MNFDPSAFRRLVLDLLDRYGQAFGPPADRHAVLRCQIAAGDDIHSRRTFPGHVTASAIVLDPSGRRTLLIHHRALDRWLQPGGHYEPPESLPASALREAAEETGLSRLVLDPWHRLSGLPIDIDSHLIPARPERKEPEHWHHDIRYVVREAETAAIRPDLAEVHAAMWHGVEALEPLMPQAYHNMRGLGLILP